MIYPHHQMPEGFVRSFAAVGVFVECQGDILQLLRAPHLKVEPLRWGAPAGKVETGESSIEAAVRELREETGLVVSTSQLQVERFFYVVWPNVQFEYLLFKLIFPFKPEIKLSAEHVASAWIPPAFAKTLDLMTDEWECIEAVYNL